MCLEARVTAALTALVTYSTNGSNESLYSAVPPPLYLLYQKWQCHMVGVRVCVCVCARGVRVSCLCRNRIFARELCTDLLRTHMRELAA